MKNYAWFAIAALFICCNSTKKVLNDPAKTQKVVDAYLLKSPFKIDTVYKPGDTTTTLLISYDTTFLPSPSAWSDGDTLKPFRIWADSNIKQISKTVIKTNTIHDTVTIRDNRLLNACQDRLRNIDLQLQVQKNETLRQAQRGDKWVGIFWAFIIIILVVSFFAIKLKLL